MKILILGAGGMFGHKAVQRLRAVGEVTGTLRNRPAHFPAAVFDGAKIINGLDVSDHVALTRIIKDIKPDVLINATGIIKQRDEAKEAVTSIHVNALLPHVLADICEPLGTYFITLGTDCVFACEGQGPYRETDIPNPTDLYGRSKLLGEVLRPNCLTLRMSIIGRELSATKRSLFEWVYANKGQTVNGYRRALYSGLTTGELTNIIAGLITRKDRLSGVFHVAGPAITKHELVCEINAIFNLGMTVLPYDDFVCDRRLNHEKFTQATGYMPPSWQAMLKDMLEQNSVYGY